MIEYTTSKYDPFWIPSGFDADDPVDPDDRDGSDEPETAVCPQCGDTAYMGDDGVYVCVDCGNEFGDND